jgi:two-component system, OmpR family, phosphate regulon response regulator PhoB
MSGKRILIVEDDRQISKLVKYNLDKAGYECNVMPSGEEAFVFLGKEAVDLVILDIMLPAMDGFEFCRKIKQSDDLKKIPVIILTAKGEEVDRVVGFELGADDYIVKPFSPRELILRVKAILRRVSPAETKKEILRQGILTVDVPRHKVIVSQKEVELTPLEFKLLITLIERKGVVQTRDKILSDVWNMDADIYTRTIDTHIKRLREKLGKAGAFIETVVGLGYRFRQEGDDED